MTNVLRQWFDRFRGAGEYSITVPPMDSALRSNNALEEADRLFDWHEPTNLLHDGKSGYFSSGPRILTFDGSTSPQVVATCSSDVSAMARFGDTLAVGLDGGGIRLIGGSRDGATFAASSGFEVNCPIALAFNGPDRLVVANGSSQHRPSQWRHDLLLRNAKGSIWELNLETGKAQRLAAGLAWPYGVLPLADGSLVVSEAWRARLVKLSAGAAPVPVLTDLPAYPARILPKADGAGYWLPMFAPRRRIVELVMREPAYRNRMMAEIEPAYWIAPSLRPMESYYEPLQGGTLKKLAMLKPWAPSRSYGLVVELDQEFQPIRSFHSRADGTRHGISSCADLGDRLLVAATGGDIVISIVTGEAPE